MARNTTPPKEDRLTDRQRELLKYLQTCISDEQRIPSYREMAKAMGVSAVGTIQDHVSALVEEGYLERDGRKLKLTQNRQIPTYTVPIVGEVAAGALQDAYEVSLGALTLTPDMLRNPVSPNELFALRVRGESMIEAGINPGDMIVVQKNARVKNGDFVVVDLEGEATVKEIQMPKDKSQPVMLIPKNKTMKPIEVPADERLNMLGKVICVQRYYLN